MLPIVVGAWPAEVAADAYGSEGYVHAVMASCVIMCRAAAVLKAGRGFGRREKGMTRVSDAW